MKKRIVQIFCRNFLKTGICPSLFISDDYFKMTFLLVSSMTVSFLPPPEKVNLIKSHTNTHFLLTGAYSLAPSDKSSELYEKMSTCLMTTKATRILNDSFFVKCVCVYGSDDGTLYIFIYSIYSTSTAAMGATQS